MNKSLKVVLFFSLFFCLFNFLLSFAAECPRYEITARLDTKNHTITASQKVIFTNNSDTALDALYFHVYPHRRYTKKEIGFMYRYAGYFKMDPFPEGFQGGDLKIEKISSRGNVLSYRMEGDDQTILKVGLDSSLKPGDSQEIILDFKVDIPHAYGRFGWHQGITSLARWYPLLSVVDKSGWHNYPFYIYHQPYFSEASYYKVTLTLPQDEVVASTALVKTKTDNPDGTKTLMMETEFPVRDFALGVSKSFLVHSIASGEVTIQSYYLKGDEKRAVAAASYAASLMRYYAERFGSYPYKAFSIVPSYLGYGGCQSSCFIFIDTRVYRVPGFLERYFNFLIAHETGHQWFYNIIGSDEYREMFLDEGMNSYWILRYLEHTYGPDAQVLTLPPGIRWLVPNFSFHGSTVARYLYLAKNGLDGPVVSDLSSFQEPSSIFALTYGKGAAVLEMLNAEVGSQVFEGVMKRYTGEFRFKNFSFDDFMRICNEESGKDLTLFFHGWLKTKQACDYAVKPVARGAFILENRGLIVMPVETKITYHDGTESIFPWDGAGKNIPIPLTGGKTVSKVVVDPDKKIILDLDRVNNSWPRNIFLKPVPWYFFAYEIPSLMPDGSYNVVLGPDLRGQWLGAAASAAKPYDGLVKVSSLYNFNDKESEYTAGYEFPHLFNKQVSVGVDVFNRQYRLGRQDVSGGKLYIRRELWPARYGIFDLNDHVTLYLLKDQKLDQQVSVNGAEDARNIVYRKTDETILGLAASLCRYGPYSDPDYGWKLIPQQEFAGHFLGGNESFWRTSLELDTYRLLLPKFSQKLATRLKVGWGGSGEKGLFDLGGADGLRGYGRETVEGSRMMLGSAEYRFPLCGDMKMYFLDNVFCLNKIQAVGFFDIAKAWYNDFGSANFKKNAGVGLRLHFDIVGFLEKVVLRFDIARPINDSKESTHFWVGLSHAF
ncbi:MAG: M1 family aminopeptidase [Candidatus Omnitrophota bacterium]|jgi:hypothetical protein